MLSAPHSQGRILWFFAAVAVITALVMFKVELPLLLGLNAQWERRIDPYRWSLHVHALFGTIALCCAPAQFFARLRKGKRRLHRWLGRCYALAVLVSAPIGIYIALAHLQDNEKWAAVTLGVLWLASTAVAVRSAMRGQVRQHRLWAARSYGLTLTFVASRFVIDVLKIDGAAIAGGNGGLVWLCTLVALAGASWLGGARAQAAPPRHAPG
ncbi:MAG: DUF2306 domain-containing protein [Pseudomonadota bacterium]